MVVASWDWINRLIYLAVADYDPIDIYREHRAIRLADESVRQYAPLVRAVGGLPKTPTESFGNALQMISGATFPPVPTLPLAKIVPIDGSGVNTVGGEIVTDDPNTDSDPFNTTGLAQPPRINMSPISVIQKVTVGSAVEPQDVVDIKDAIFSEIMEDGETFIQSVRLIRANAAGDIVQLPDGSYAILSKDGSIQRIEGQPSANDGRDITATNSL